VQLSLSTKSVDAATSDFFGETPSVPRVAPLRYDTFETELTGVTKDERAIFLIEMLIELQSRRGLSQHFPLGGRDRLGVIWLIQFSGTACATTCAS
jgi:hypothetical protein